MEEIKFKKCGGKYSQCGNAIKPITEFSKCGLTKAGNPSWRPECKECYSKARHPNKKKNLQERSRKKEERLRAEENERKLKLEAKEKKRQQPITHKKCTGKFSQCDDQLKPIEEFHKLGLMRGGKPAYRPECKKMCPSFI